MKTIRFDRDHLIVLNHGLDFRLKTNLAVRFVLKKKKNLQRTISKKVAYPCSSCKTDEPVDLNEDEQALPNSSSADVVRRRLEVEMFLKTQKLKKTLFFVQVLPKENIPLLTTLFVKRSRPFV